ncbi:MAG: GAF domain-containing protein [Pedobacter sp.]|nr:MAG: GAF domain-containing protein [Pedobacter sp.]
MKITDVDLDNCSIEPIHIPGQVQSHGFIIAIDKNLTICYVSENIHDFIPDIPTLLPGRSVKEIEALVGSNEPPDFIERLIVFGKTNGFEQTNPFKTDIRGKAFYLIISTSPEHYLLEFEPALSDNDLDVQKMIGKSISEMLADKNLVNLLNNTARQVKNVIGYDRIMVYKFHEDGHGEVVAESKNEDLEPWLGLHYPASDIPRQARDLYKLNLTRLIADVHTTPSKIVTTRSLADVPLDMTNSHLRAVSPIHIQYLKNMKVASSFSISLLYHKELWGLIACHNYTPRFIDFKSRESSRLIGQILSSALEFRQDEENQQMHDKLKSVVDYLSKFMLKSNSIESALTENEHTFLSATDASGAVLVYEKNIIKLGQTPDDEQLHDLIEWISSTVVESIYYTDALSSVYPPSKKYAHLASGMMVSVISEELKEYAIWFKPEQLQTIKWAGDPNKPAELFTDGKLQISPRKSFEVWAETVAGRSKSWSAEEIKSVVRLKGEILYAINQKASEIRLLNDKLKQAYEELDTFSFTISHDLKNPLSTIKSFSQILKRDKNITGQSQHMLDRIVAGADKMNYMIKEVLEYSRIGKSELDKVDVAVRPLIDDLIRDFSMIYPLERTTIDIGEIHSIKGDQLMLSQVFSNLLSNAIKYSMPVDAPHIELFSEMTDQEIVFCIRDNGIGIDIKQLPKVFDLFKRMPNAEDIEGTGVGLAIVKRIVAKHKGKIWVDSEIGKGSSFYLSFPKN